MPTLTYHQRRGQLETYFDRTALEAWARMTSDAPLSRIRATVRAGRDAMRQTLLDWLPDDMRGARLLDAGCGTGALASEAAKRGAEVLAVDISPSLISIAKERLESNPESGRIDFRVGDLHDPSFGSFDFVVAMDSLIHYQARDIGRVLAGLSARTSTGVLFTFAPRTPLLSVMHAAGRLFPRGDRAPAIEPVGEQRLRQILAQQPETAGRRVGRTKRIASGFYTSQAMEVLAE